MAKSANKAGRLAVAKTYKIYIGGKFPRTESARYYTLEDKKGNVIANVCRGSRKDFRNAVVAARKAQPGWEALGGHGRARVLYAIARLLQKNARLFAVLETLDNGKPIRESRDIDIPLAQRHFYYHAGMAQLDRRPNRSAVGQVDDRQDRHVRHRRAE